MFMEGPSNNRLPTDLSTQIGGAGGVKKVLGNPTETGSGKNSEILGNGTAAVSPGADLPNITRAMIAMKQEGLAPAGNFHTSKHPDGLNVIEHPINAQMKALPPEDSNPNITAAFTDLEARAKGSPTLASPQEISLGKEAIIPNTGIIIDIFIER